MAVVLPFVATFVDKGAKEAVKAVKQVDQEWSKFHKSIAKAAVPAAAVGGALVVGLTNAKKVAGEAAKSQKVLNQALANSGYPQNAKAAGEYAREVSRATGIDQSAIRLAQAKLAANDEIAASTDKMARGTMLAADMVAQGYGTMEGNAVVLAKALEDPAKGMMMLNRMGITFSKQQQAEIKASMKAGNESLAQQQVIAGVMGTVSGAAEENASSTAKMRAAYTDLAIQVGSALLPAFAKISQVLATVFGWMGKHIGITKALIAVVGGAVTIILTLNAAFKAQAAATALAHSVQGVYNKLLGKGVASNTAMTAATTIATASQSKHTVATIAQSAATKAMSVAQGIARVATKGLTVATRSLNAAMKANPIGFVVGLVMALVAALAYAWRNSETFRRIVTKAFEAVKKVAQTVFSAIAKVIQPVVDLLKRIIDLAKGVADSIGNVIKKIPGLGKAADAAASAGKSVGAATRSTGGGGVAAPIVINVNGALDPERVARQIRDLLDGHDLRQGRVVTRAVAW